MWPASAGQGQIDGQFTVQEAQALVAVLSVGLSLPYHVDVQAGET